MVSAVDSVTDGTVVVVGGGNWWWDSGVDWDWVVVEEVVSHPDQLQ